MKVEGSQLFLEKRIKMRWERRDRERGGRLVGVSSVRLSRYDKALLYKEKKMENFSE